jgi:glutamyl-tRNA reductase
MSYQQSPSTMEVDMASGRPAAEPQVIIQFRAALADIQARELKRLYDRLPDLDVDSRRAIAQCAEHLVERVLLTPAQSLVNDAASCANLSEALRRLFQLER